MAASVTATTNSLSIMESCNLAAANSLSELAQTVKEKGLWIFGESESKRRVITIEKKNGSYGFTLQSYGVRYKHGNRETDFITYVNAVEKDGAAFYAGLREGDVILSINGQNMARVEHRSLVSFIRKCPSHLKMVVVSDERARKVELHMRYVHLQKKLHDKMNELEQLNKKEKEILTGTYESHSTHSIKSVGGTCLAEATSACCFCPSKTKLAFLDDKEKSKSMGPSEKIKDKDIHYSDCYRKTQSSKELHKHPSSSNPIKLQISTKTPSGGELVPSASASGGVVGISKGLNQCHHTHHQTTTSTPVAGESVIQQKPKSCDNLMTTKSFGGYGFGFGYGYYPSNSKSGHSHFSHPHHHNHHTHCGSHPHSSYYYNKGGPTCNKGQTQQAQSSHSRERRSSSETGNQRDQSSRPFTNYTTYKMMGTTRVVARVTMGNIDTSVGTCTRTLPSMRSSSSSRHTPDSGSFSSKMEKTLSDSSLNSEHHKDFPKSMSYFSRGCDNDARFSSDDEYDEYATEPNYGGKHDIYV